MSEILPSHLFGGDKYSRSGRFQIELDTVINNPGLVRAVFDSLRFVPLNTVVNPASRFVEFSGLSTKFRCTGRGKAIPEYGLSVDTETGETKVLLIQHGVDVSSASDIELLQELIKRNGKAPAAKTTSRQGEWFSITVGIGKDETAEITLTDDALKALGDLNA